MLSDDSSVDSDSGIRFKTDSTRKKDNSGLRSSSEDRRHHRDNARRFRSRSKERARHSFRTSDRYDSRQRRDSRGRDTHNTPLRRDRYNLSRHAPSRKDSRTSPRRNVRISPRRDSRISPRSDRRTSPRSDRDLARRYRQDKSRRSERDSSKRETRNLNLSEIAKSSMRKEKQDSSRDERENLISKNKPRSPESRDRSGSAFIDKEADKRKAASRSVINKGNDKYKDSRHVSKRKTQEDELEKGRDKSSLLNHFGQNKTINTRETPEQNSFKKHRKPSPMSFSDEGVKYKKISDSESGADKHKQNNDLRYKLSSAVASDRLSTKVEHVIAANDRSSSEDSKSDIQPTSYYNLITIDEVKSESQPETIDLGDSSEDEKALHDRLLVLEKELQKTKEFKKIKHKEKKHKRTAKKTKKHTLDTKEHQKAEEYVSSTTDVKHEPERTKSPLEEISSTAPRRQNTNELSEEGEIISDAEDILSKHAAFPDSSVMVLSSSKEEIDDSSLVSGPALPPHLAKKFETGASDNNDENNVEGPALPPHLKTVPGDEIKIVGPAITEDQLEKLLKTDAIECSTSQSNHSDSEASDDGAIGPLPEDAKHKWTKAHESLEERALHIKIGSIDSCNNLSSDAVTREEWMLELPEAKAHQLGRGARQFRTREGPDLTDRSSWTDTPKEKALKAAGIIPEKETPNNDLLQEDASKKFIAERDDQQEQAVRKHKKKHNRGESLLEQHQKKLKKKKKKEEKEAGGKIRRPFDRDIDLGVNRFDEAQKKSIIKKAQLLDTRFSSGESKFL